MMQKYFITNLEECKKIWNTLMPIRNVSDLWEFRACFQRHFNLPPSFLVLEDRKGVAAMLPLSYIGELDLFAFFPGETWKGKTWMERNPIYLRDREFLPELLGSCPERTYLRYLELQEEDLISGMEVDETGYVLYPANMDFDFSQYRSRFSGKRIKEILKTIRSLTDGDCFFRYNNLEDFEDLVKMSVAHFGEDSYLYDHRFRACFRDVMRFLHAKGWLRMLGVRICGKTVAVDLGALFRDTYTVFLGGTHAEFPGIAKAMNMHHIEFAFHEGIPKVDFLCGDFHWKVLWHLDAEPLYKFVSSELASEDAASDQNRVSFQDVSYAESTI